MFDYKVLDLYLFHSEFPCALINFTGKPFKKEVTSFVLFCFKRGNHILEYVVLQEEEYSEHFTGRDGRRGSENVYRDTREERDILPQ